jgi:8-oxo-dGTP pyrophosphatase MutT (NUDIX family)
MPNSGAARLNGGGMIEPLIHRVTELDLKVQSWPWPWAAARRAEIDAFFAKRRQEKPGIWNGRVLLARNADFSGGRLSSSYFETDFASFLAWRDWGFPDRDVFNGFGMGALRSADGAFVLGEMGGHTVNAGRIYFPGGTPDPEDVAGDRLHIAGSIAREIEEETGLTDADYRPVPHWDCVVTAASIAILRILDVDAPGQALKARIEANLARQEHPELSGIHLVRTRADFRASMPRFVTAFLESQLSE